MRIGIYQDLRNPPPWRRPWAEHYQRGLARVQRAEELGLDSVWLTEHHFFEDGYLPQPHVYAAAVAARTSRIRIGTAIALPLRPAIEFAEQAAVLDIISGGRFELGLGVGYRIPEFEAFGLDARKRFDNFETVLSGVQELLREGGITPMPLQDPFPVWAGVMGPRGARIAGRHGAGLLWLDGKLLPAYREGLEQGGHDPAAARMSGLINVIVSSDPESAWERIKPHYAYQLDTYARYGAEGTDKAGALVFEDMGEGVDVEALRAKGDDLTIPFFDVLTPEDLVGRLQRFVGPGLPVVEGFFWDCIAGMDDDLVDEHIELLATKVRPAVEDLGA